MQNEKVEEVNQRWIHRIKIDTIIMSISRGYWLVGETNSYGGIKQGQPTSQQAAKSEDNKEDTSIIVVYNISNNKSGI